MNWLGILSGIAICLGSILSYVPQFYKIIKYNSIEGISEITLVLMNIGLMCLTMNSIIYSWNYFFCKDINCFSNLLPFIQISLSWIMVLIYYFIYITYKFNKNKREKRILSGLHYIISYILFTIFVIGIALGEKLKGHISFFHIFADVLGYSSAVLNSLVYLPQIYKLYRLKSIGNLSFLMYGIQTPGNIIVIVFQAIIYSSPVSTWITYVIVLIEQGIILLLMTVYYFRSSYQRDETEFIY